MRLDHRTIAWCRYLLLVGTVLGAAGCGGSVPKGPDVPTSPVTGKITVDGKEMTIGVVSFYPNEGRGNKSILVPTGQIAKDGTYKMQTSGKDGAPPGWYKVTISANSPTGPISADAPSPPENYQNKLLTELQIEVLETPPATGYNFNLTK